MMIERVLDQVMQSIGKKTYFISMSVKFLLSKQKEETPIESMETEKSVGINSQA